MAPSTLLSAFRRHHLGVGNEGAHTPGVGAPGRHLDSRGPWATPTAHTALPGDTGHPPANHGKRMKRVGAHTCPQEPGSPAGLPAHVPGTGRACRSLTLFTHMPQLPSAQGGRCLQCWLPENDPLEWQNMAFTGHPRAPRADLILTRERVITQARTCQPAWSLRGGNEGGGPKRAPTQNPAAAAEAGRMDGRGRIPNVSSAKQRPEWVGSRFLC